MPRAGRDILLGMMRLRLLLVAVFAAVTIAGVAAQAFSVSYLDGSVDLKTAKGWKALVIGDKVPADASVRLSQEASLELQRGKTRITLLKDGTYEMAALSKAADAPAAGSSGNVIAQKLQSLTTEKPKTATAAGGVRGAEQGSVSVTWADESDEARTQVQALLDQKKYADAVKVLDQAITESTLPSEKNEFSYMKAVAYYGAGQPAQAYRTLVRVPPQPEDSWYARYIILKAQILVDTQNFRDALALLTPFIEQFPKGEATQVAWLLSASCDRGLGDPAAAKESLDAGYQLDPASDTAKLIDEQRKMK
jgi:tetratricopeptide (TPR) repeat protein